MNPLTGQRGWRFLFSSMVNQRISERAWGWWVLAVVWFAVGHIVWSAPAWASPLNTLPGPLGDNAMMLWNLGWVKYALSHGSPGFWCNTMYAPDGFLFIYGSHTWLDGVLCWLTSWVLPGGYRGLILWANLYLMAATVATGLLAIWALRAWGIRQWPLLILGASVVAFSWFRSFALSGHYNLFSTHWMLASLAALSWGRAAWHGGEVGALKKWSILGGALLGVAALNDQTMAIFAAALAGVILLSMRDLRSFSTGWKRHAARAGGWYYGVAALVAMVHLGPIIYYAAAGRLGYYRVEKNLPRLVDASSLVVPNDRHFLQGALAGVREAHHLRWSEGTYLGGVLMFLLLAVAWGAMRFVFTRAERYRLPFYGLLICMVLVVLCLGDKLVVGDREFFRLPGYWLKELPLLNNLRVPQRWVWPLELVITVAGVWCAARWGSGSIGAWQGKRRMSYYLPLALAVIPMVEGRWFPQAAPADYAADGPSHPTGLLRAMAENPTAGAILVMPVEVGAAEADILQTVGGHRNAYTLGYVARTPVDLQKLPWKWNGWTREAGEWMARRGVTMVVFPFHEASNEEFANWVREARKAVPNLVVLDKHGTVWAGADEHLMK